MMKRLLSVTLLVALGAGCSVTTESPTPSEKPSTQTTNEETEFEDVGDPNEVFTQTLIVVKDDGTTETRSSTITRAEQWELRRLERESEKLSQAAQSPSVDWHSDVMPQHGWKTVAPGTFGVCSGTGLLVLWDEENYVGNQLCLSYYQQFAAGQPLFVPGLDMSTISRGSVVLGCGYHTWWEAPRTCVYTGGVWQWQYSPLGLVSLQARSAKNNTAGPAIFSTHFGRNQGTNNTVSAGTHLPSMFMTQRYLKALP